MFQDREKTILEAVLIQDIAIMVVGCSDYLPVYFKFDIGLCDSTLDVDLENSQMKIEFRFRSMGKDTVWIKFSGFYPSNEKDIYLLDQIIAKINTLLPKESDRLRPRKSSRPGTKIFYWRQ